MMDTRQSTSSRLLCLLLMVAVAMTPVTPATAKDTSSPTPSFDVEYDLRDAFSKLSDQLSQLKLDPDALGTIPCRQSALKVASQALFFWDIKTHLGSALKETTDAIRDGAKLAGANTLAKVAQICGEVIEAYDTDQPEAALGRAIINNSVDWASDQAKSIKSGSDTVDETIKEKAKGLGEAAKQKFINALFPGPLAKRITRPVSIPGLSYCKVDVTVDFQAPSGGGKGGLFFLVRGECDCHNPNNLDHMRWFQVSAFLPLEGMDSRVEWHKNLFKKTLDVKDLLKSSQAFSKGVKDSLKEDSDEEKPDLGKLAKDVADKADSASKIDPVIILTPRFAKPTTDKLDIKTGCGCDDSSTIPNQPQPRTATGIGTPATTPTPADPGAQEAEHICEKQCLPLYNTWQDDRARRQQIGEDLFLSAHTPEDAAALKDMYKQALEREDASKLEYYRCLEHCYNQAVGAGLIPAVPKEVHEKANPPEKSSPKTGTGTELKTSQAPLKEQLPEGAVFATATVEPDTQIEVQQPGYALVATADVVTARRVNKGDRLDSSSTSSIAFDDGTGLLIKTAKIVGPGLTATVGLATLLGHHDHPPALPIQNGSSTMYVGSDKPFATPALTIDDVTKTPDTTQAVFLNPRGEKIGQLSTFKGLQVQPSSRVAVATMDSSGALQQQSKIEGGALNTSALVSFDRPSYNAGDHGTLQIHVGKYEQGVAATRFGGAAGLTQETIRIVPLSEVKGLPSEVPYGDHSLSFQTTHPGQARVAVYMPRAVPPRKIENPGDDKVLKQASQSFESWVNLFPKE